MPKLPLLRFPKHLQLEREKRKERRKGNNLSFTHTHTNTNIFPLLSYNFSLSFPTKNPRTISMSSKRNYQASSPSPIGSPSQGNNICDINSSKEQDRLLPIANVSRIMKKSLPSNAKISKEAKETVQECVSEFISFITGEASDKCQREKRKTVNGDDLLWAMTTLGFENYVGPLKIYLNKYREVEGEKNFMARQEDHHSPSNGAHHDHHDHDQRANISSKASNSSVPLIDKVDFQDFSNGGFYSLGGQVNIPKSYEEISTTGMAFGYENNYVMSGNGTHESGGDGNANRVMAAQRHHGIGW